MSLFERIKDRLQGKAPKGAKRSPSWPKVRRKHLEKNPRCFVCGSSKKVRVHHMIPFHVAPDLELDPNNLMSLCEYKKYGKNCHQLFGHLGDFRRVNLNVEIDAQIWRMKLGKW